MYQLTMMILLSSRQNGNATHVLINFLCQALQEREMIAECNSVFMAKMGAISKNIDILI
jgi:hypothetical protein